MNLAYCRSVPCLSSTAAKTLVSLELAALLSVNYLLHVNHDPTLVRTSKSIFVILHVYMARNKSIVLKHT